MIDPAEYRRVVGHFATGVVVVTGVRYDGAPVGLTVSAFTSVSLDPTLVLVCLDEGSETRRWIGAGGRFAVNVLRAGREAEARRFATAGADRFAGVGWRAEATGAPVLDDALAWLDCRVREVLPGGDHTVFLGEVVACDAHEGAPLLYYRGGFGRLAS